MSTFWMATSGTPTRKLASSSSDETDSATKLRWVPGAVMDTVSPLLR